MSKENTKSKIAICADRFTEFQTSIIRFARLEEFTESFRMLYENGNIWGVYENDAGEIIVEENDGKTYKDMML